MSNLIKILPMLAAFFHADGQTDWHDEANSRFSQFCERAYTPEWLQLAQTSLADEELQCDRRTDFLCAHEVSQGMHAALIFLSSVKPIQLHCTKPFLIASASIS